MSEEFFEQSVNDVKLGELLNAYELVVEIAKSSSGKNSDRATVAANIIDMSITTFSHYGTKAGTERLKVRMEEVRLLPIISD